MAALAIVSSGVIAFAQEKGVESVEIQRARPQPQLLGEIRESEVPPSLFYQKQKTIVNRNFLLTSGYLTKTDRPFGRIVDAQTEGESHAEGAIVFIDKGSNDGVEPGSRYFIYRRVKDVGDPKTRKPYGHVISIIGTLEVSGVKHKTGVDVTGGKEAGRKGYVSRAGVKPTIASAEITQAFTSILVGDYIVPEYRVQIPMIDPDRPVVDKSLKATVVAVSPEKNSSSTNDVVYLNVGRNEGVSEGDIFGISPKLVKGSQSEKYGIKKRVAKVLVIMTRPETATAIVVSASDEIFVGDAALFLQER